MTRPDYRARHPHELRDPMATLAEGVQRIIEQVRAERTAERDARYEAWRAAHPAEPEQLTIESEAS